MSNVFDLFPRAEPPASGALPQDSVDVGIFAWWSMSDLRKAAGELDTPSGRTLVADICCVVARELVYSRYAEPGAAGAFRAISTETALRRAVDLLDLAAELYGRIPQNQSGDE